MLWVGAWFSATDESGAWVGMALAATNEGHDDAHLFGIWVAPEARGSGAAVMLCDACAERASANGYTGIGLEVAITNIRATAAYRRAGFVPITERTGERDLPVTVMHRPV